MHFPDKAYCKTQIPHRSRGILNYNEKAVINHLLNEYHEAYDIHINENDVDETILYNDDNISENAKSIWLMMFTILRQ